MMNRAFFPLEERGIAAMMYFGRSVAKIMARRIREGFHVKDSMAFYSKAADWCPLL